MKVFVPAFKYIVAIENIIYAGEEFLHHLLDLINNIIAQDSIPELVKVGLLSPIYKNKGDKNDSNNYRGIVVLPIICKCYVKWSFFI
jgi:hypothetical protein